MNKLRIYVVRIDCSILHPRAKELISLLMIKHTINTVNYTLKISQAFHEQRMLELQLISHILSCIIQCVQLPILSFKYQNLSYSQPCATRVTQLQEVNVVGYLHVHCLFPPFFLAAFLLRTAHAQVVARVSSSNAMSASSQAPSFQLSCQVITCTTFDRLCKTLSQLQQNFYYTKFIFF